MVFRNMYFLLHPITFLNHSMARLMTDQLTFLFSIIFFIFLALNYKSLFWRNLDDSVSHWAQESKGNFVKSRSGDFAFFGNAIFHILFSIILMILFFIAKHKTSIVLAILFTLIFSWALNRIMKLVFKRTRPEHMASNIRRRMSYCFPSGHVMASISIYFFSAVILQSLIPFIPWYIVAMIISFFVVMSRIYLNHHFFTDVLAGITMGIFCLNLSIWFYFFMGLV